MNDLCLDDYKFKIIENIDDEDLLDMFDSNNVVYVKPGIYAMSTRKLEALIRIAYIQKYYQCNPVGLLIIFSISNCLMPRLISCRGRGIVLMFSCLQVVVLVKVRSLT
jgi:hypothetical protein